MCCAVQDRYDVLCKIRRLEEAIVFLDEQIMVCQIVVRMEEGVAPSVITMNTIAGGLCRAGRVGAALEFLREKRIAWPEAKGNTVTYSTS
jgi:pentatricopeptide repeat protein